MNKYLAFIIRDYKIIKISFAIITILLLYDELNIFFIKKPTLSSVSKSQLRPQNFPDIIICPVPGFDQRAIERLGYNSSYSYSMGSMAGGGTGWFGNQSQAWVSICLCLLSISISIFHCQNQRTKNEFGL